MAIRNERMKENGGTHTKQELKILVEVQENSCYFCGNEIELKNGSKKAHADHYESIFYGGRNDIQNIVMTCSACNLKKGASNGDYFETLIRKNRSSETSKKLRAIRRKIKILKEELQALNLKAPRKSLKTV